MRQYAHAYSWCLVRPGSGVTPGWHYTPSNASQQMLVDVGDREHLMTCVNCGCLMWGFYEIEEEP